MLFSQYYTSWRKHVTLPAYFIVAFLIPVSLYADSQGRIQPTDLIYQGAFRLPDVSGDCDWTYSGHAMTYYPLGDPGGGTDGYSGSLFATGSDANCQFVSEISIPKPVHSAFKRLNDLPVAKTLQPFSDIRSNLFGSFASLSIPRVGLEYLAPQEGQRSGKLYFCWAQHIQSFEASHGWCEVDLSDPKSRGAWYFASYTNYVTNDYLFSIPPAWAAANTPGLLLASGRAREGIWAGRGLALFAYGPWNEGNPPFTGATLVQIKPLLLYGTQQPGIPELTSTAAQAVNGYSDADHWYGGAWLTSGSDSSVIFAGTKALGHTWYGFSNGLEWPHDCAETNSCPAVPPWPHDDRGFWADDFAGQMIFYDSRDLAAVAGGTLKSWDPQPYASHDLSSYLFQPDIDVTRYRRDIIGATAFNRADGLLFVIERQVDEEKSIIHVWKLLGGDGGGTTAGAMVGSRLLLLR